MQHPKVLVVEDETLLHMFLEDALTEAGFEVTILSNGTEAIAKLEDQPTRFAALVTDIRLEGHVNGWGLAQRARELYSDLAVAYISGDSSGEWAAKGVPESVMLAKPFAMAQLATAVAQLLNKKAVAA